MNFGPAIKLGVVTDERTKELSGLADAGPCLLIIRDSGNPSSLFGLNHDGTVRDEWPLIDSATNEPAKNNDWEDMAVGPGPVPGSRYVYIAEHSAIAWRCLMPDVRKPGCITPAQKLNFTLAPEDAQTNSETLMIDQTTGDLFKIPRGPDGSSTHKVLWIPDVKLKTSGQFQAIGTIGGFDPSMTVTAGDISRDGKMIALLQHQSIHVWVVPDGKSVKDTLVSQPATLVVPFNVESLGEALCFGWYRKPGDTGPWHDGIFCKSEKIGGGLWWFPRI
jgi:hypothetical protein